MKKNYVLFFALFLLSGYFNAQATHDEDLGGADQCYCSYVCEFREVTDEDAPFICPETGVCFCRVRDQEKFFENGCDAYENSYAEVTYCSASSASHD